MTREHKLALIVGFSLVLVVGILISDHLSPASLDEPLETLSFNLPLADPEAFVVPSPRSSLPTNRMIEEQPAEPITPGDRGSSQLPIESLADDASSEPGPAPQDEVKPFEIVQGTGGRNVEQPGGRRGDSPRIPGFVPVGGERQGGAPKPPTYTEYVVKKGDTLAGIARRFLGSDERWPELQALNPGLVSPEGGVNADVKLKIPVLVNSNEGTPARVDTTPAHKPEVKPEQKPRNDTRPASARTYVVKANDTLSQIAQRELNSKNRMAEILKLNKDKISNPDEIYEGLKLILPAA